MGAMVYDSALGAWKDADLVTLSGGARQECSGMVWDGVNQVWVEVDNKELILYKDGNEPIAGTIHYAPSGTGDYLGGMYWYIDISKYSTLYIDATGEVEVHLLTSLPYPLNRVERSGKNGVKSINISGYTGHYYIYAGFVQGAAVTVTFNVARKDNYVSISEPYGSGTFSKLWLTK